MDQPAGSGLVAGGIAKSFDGTPVLDGVNLTMRAGEFVTLLGPSGCGKTTLLRILAGLELPEAGRVVLHGEDLTATPAHRRPVNTVFQSYALFPHLSVFENVAFGLRSRRIVPTEIRRRTGDSLDLLKIRELAGRRPDALSGGQRQRVALARALVNEPALLLLDEPMSALDAKLRGELQLELRRLQRRLGTMFLLVTHDQDEAMTVSDRICVMRGGRIEQSGEPAEVYERPRSAWVASFLGRANLIPARAAEGRRVETPLGPLELRAPLPGAEGTLMIRPERVRPAGEAANGNRVTVRVTEVVYRGDHADLLAEPGPLRIRTPPPAPAAPGAELVVELPTEYLEVVDA